MFHVVNCHTLAMMMRHAATVSLLGVVGCTTFPASVEELPPFYVFFKDAYGLRFGSGIQLSRGWVVTNEHVVRTLHRPSIQLVSGAVYSTGDVVIADNMDIAFVAIPCNNSQPYQKPILEEAFVGQEVVSLGPSRALLAGSGVKSSRIVKLHAYVSHEEGPVPKSKGFLHSNTIPGGFSGGPVLNKNGHLIGINQGVVAVSSLENKRYSFAYTAKDVIHAAQRALGADWDAHCQPQTLN